MELEQLRKLTSKWFLGCTYGGEPYTVHLDEVQAVLREFGFVEDQLQIAAELHDVFEDTRITPGYVLSLGVDHHAVCLALLVTDEPGDNRKARKFKSYPIIASDWRAVVLKLADRIANVRRAGKWAMYQEEHQNFREILRGCKHNLAPIMCIKIDRMWKTLDELLDFHYNDYYKLEKISDQELVARGY